MYGQGDALTRSRVDAVSLPWLSLQEAVRMPSSVSSMEDELALKFGIDREADGESAATAVAEALVNGEGAFGAFFAAVAAFGAGDDAGDGAGADMTANLTAVPCAARTASVKSASVFSEIWSPSSSVHESEPTCLLKIWEIRQQRLSTAVVVVVELS